MYFSSSVLLSNVSLLSLLVRKVDEFFRLINDAYGQSINVIQTGKRKTGVSYLIKEADAIDHSKSRIARENNIKNPNLIYPGQVLTIPAA